MAKAEKKQGPKIEQPSMFFVPLGAGSKPRAAEWDECDWPMERFSVLDALSRKIPQTLEGKNGRPAPKGKNGSRSSCPYRSGIRSRSSRRWRTSPRSKHSTRSATS